MRKEELTPWQLEARQLIVEELQAHGWHAPTNENQMFDQGLWVMCEVFMKYGNPSVRLAVTFRGDQNALYLSIEMVSGGSIELKMEVDDQLPSILETITSFQDEITPSNYRDHVRSLIRTCANIYVMEKNEKFVRLTDVKI